MTGRARFELDNGVLVLLEESHEIPLVDVEIALRTGAVHDPEGRDGVMRFVARMIRMGTKKLRAPEVEEAIASLGARLSVDVSTSCIRFQGAVIKRNAEAFLRLLGKLILEPAFRAGDLAHVKRETLADLVAARDNDRALAARAFRRAVFGSHAYGRGVVGTRGTIKRIKREDVEAAYRTHFVASNVIVGIAGDTTEDEVRPIVSEVFGAIPRGAAPVEEIDDPAPLRGRRVVIVDKPERTQTQIYAGALGNRVGDPAAFALLVANTVFGGTFTARLMQAIRVDKGWSYGAYSRIGQDRRRDAWYMWTFPAAKDAVKCIELELELLAKFVEEGATAAEVEFSRGYLAKSHCFEIDTAAKRLDPRIDVELYDLPSDYYDRYVEQVLAVTPEAANAAVRERLSAKDLAIVLLATASEVREGLEKLPGVESVQVVPFDSD